MLKENIKISSVIFILILFCSCKREESGKIDNSESETIEAHYLKIKYYDDFSIVSIINPWDTTKFLANYILIGDESEIPEEFKDFTPVHVPLQRGVVFSSVHSGAIAELGASERIKGIVDAIYFKDEFIKEGLKKGEIVDLGNSNNPSIEKVIALNPDGILLTLYDGFSSQLDRPGMKLIKFVDNMEETPLGRAEWIKFIGRLVGKKEVSDSIFKSVSKEYNSLKNRASEYDCSPKIMAENMYQGVWYVPGGNSYQARMIEDAGGAYIWGDDNSNGSLNLSFETVLDKAQYADFWLLKLYGEELTKESLLAQDSRYRFFKCVDQGGVYYANTERVNLFEEFPYHPEHLLKDYIIIFHPKTETDTLRYFRKMVR